jgi:hypothetical protein
MTDKPEYIFCKPRLLHHLVIHKLLNNTFLIEIIEAMIFYRIPFREEEGKLIAQYDTNLVGIIHRQEGPVYMHSFVYDEENNQWKEIVFIV